MLNEDYIGNYHHIYSRGTEKRDIFIDENDRKRFLALLYLCNNINPVDFRELISEGLTFGEMFHVKREETLVDIGGYCLMDNHIHLLIKEKK